MKKIAICICTRKRKEGIIRLLSSIEKLIIPDGFELLTIIVENDDKGYTENEIKDFANSSNLNIRYFLEKEPGLSNARNRTVKESGNCDFCCFVDDDQEVDKNWLQELVKCQKEFNSDGVTGPNPPIIEVDVPSYIKKFHEPNVFEYGQQVERAATNCLLLKKSSLNKIEGPFNLKLNFSGGEDMYLTSQITRMGGKIVYNPKAIAYEIVPEERLSIRFMINRTYRIGNTFSLYSSLLKNNFYNLKKAVHNFLRLLHGILILIPYYLFSDKNKLKGLLKIVDAWGGLMFIFGTRNNHYKISKK